MEIIPYIKQREVFQLDYNKIEDTIFKTAMDFFGQSAVDFFNINTKIVAPAQTEIKDIVINTNFTDYTFYTEDGEYLHFEFQTTNKEEDLRRFLFYDASLFYKNSKKIRTIVIYSSDIKKTKTVLDAGTIKYNIEAYYMSSINGDENYSKLKHKMETKEELSDKDILTLTFLPIMKGSESKSERVIKSIELANSMKDSNKKLKCLSMLYALLQKFGDDIDKDKVKEVLSLTEIGKLIREDGVLEGIREGKKEGKKEGKSDILLKQLTKKFGKVPKDYGDKIKELSDETIDIIALEIFDMKDIKDIERFF